MPFFHVLLAILVAAIWGFNFIFVRFALDEMSPWLLCSMRFLLASLPAVFFIKIPQAPFKMIALYGLLMFGLQFLLLFMGMQAGMSPGLASILVQVQVFFSIFFAAILLKEIPSRWQILGAIVSFSGIGLVGFYIEGDTTLLGFILIIAAAATWGLGNLITKKLSGINTIGLVVWGSLIAAVPMSLLTLWIDGFADVVNSFHELSFLGGASLAYIVYASTWVGYGVWNNLLSRYAVATVAPFTLLVPFFGILSALWILKEPFQLWKLFSGLLIVLGLSINLMYARFFMKKNLPLVSTVSQKNS